MADIEDITMIQNKIFAGVLQRKEDVFVRRQEYLTTFSDSKLFEDEFYIYAILVKEYPKLTISERFVTNFLQANRPSLESSSNIHMSKYGVAGSEPYVEFMDSCLDTFKELQKVEVVNEDFMECLEMYKMDYINRRSLEVLDTSMKILGEGIQDRGQTKVGYDAMRVFMKQGFMQIDEFSQKKERRGLITYGINDMDDAETEKDKVQRVATYGIKGLDDQLGGIYEGEMISLLAPAKGGKSRISTFILHNAVVHDGCNIVMWSIENGYKGWEALIRARHFEYFYNDQLNDKSKRVWVDDDMVRKGSMSPEVKAMELASWTDLKSNPKYGKITSIDEDFDIDTFLEVLDNAVTQTNAKLVCIDYLQLVQGSGRASKQERVAEAYQKTLQYLKRKKIAGIFPAQLKQTAVGDMNRTSDEDLVNKELRDAAGESYEVIKTPDVNLALYATVEEMKQGRMKILSIPSRNHASFNPININCSLGSCTFVDADEMVYR